MERTGPRPAKVPLHHSLYTYCLAPSGDWPVACTNAQRTGLADSVNSVRSSAQSSLSAICASTLWPLPSTRSPPLTVAPANTPG